jgi:hypothetical protein
LQAPFPATAAQPALGYKTHCNGSFKASISEHSPHSDIKEQLVVEEWSKFSKKLAAACGIFWKVGVLCQTVEIYIQAHRNSQPVLK